MQALPLREAIANFRREYCQAAIDKARAENLRGSHGDVYAIAANALEISLATLYRHLYDPAGTDDTGTVYLMHDPARNAYKIGWTSGTPLYRERTLQAEKPDIRLLKYWIAPKALENVLHWKFKAKRVRGEWFELTESDLEELEKLMPGPAQLPA
jgi:hypothetical protein